MDSLLAKKIEDKSIIWFKKSNQYVVLENVTANIVSELYNNNSIDEIAKDLEKELAIPFEKAFDFIVDVDDQIVKPNKSLENAKPTLETAFSIPESFEFVKYYKIAHKKFMFAFSNEFELSLIHPKFAHLEVKESSEIDYSFQVFNDDEKTHLALQGELIGSWNNEVIHYFQGKFSMKIIECIYEKLEENWMGVFHASAINHKENSVLILGDSGNGKSTSLALLQAYGFHCIADDFVPVDNLKNVHSFPAGISIKKNSLPVLLPHYPELKTSAEYHYKRLNKIVRYLPPKDIDYAKSYPCKALIFIKYDQNIDLDLTQISNLKAFENLIPDSWISPIPENVTVFLNWFSSLPCYQLTYSNNEKMISAVKKIFQDDL